MLAAGRKIRRKAASWKKSLRNLISSSSTRLCGRDGVTSGVSHSFQTIGNLPYELLLNIFELCSPADLASLARVSDTMSGLALTVLYQDINLDNIYKLKDCCNTLVDPTNNLARLVRSFAILFDVDTFYEAPLFLHIHPSQTSAISVAQTRQLVVDTVARMVNLDRFMCDHFPECIASMCALLSHPNTSTISHLSISILRTYLPQDAAEISYISIPSEIQPNLPFLTSLDIDAYFITVHPVTYAEFFQRLLGSHCHRLTELVLRARSKEADFLLETSSDFSLLGTLVVHPSVLVIKKLLLAPSIRTLHILGALVEYRGVVPEVSVPVNAFPQLQSLSCPSTFLPVFLRNRVDRPHLKTICLDDAFYLDKGRLPRNHTWPSWHAVRTALSGLQYSFKNLVDLSFCVVHLDIYLLLAAGLEFPSLQKLMICLWTGPLNLHCLAEDQDIQQFLTGLPSLQTFRLSDGPKYEGQLAVKLFEHATDIAFQKTAAEKWGMYSSTLTCLAFTTACEWHRELGEWYKEDHKRCLRRRDNGFHC